MIEHQVNDYTCDRYIHPHRQGPASDGAMAQKVATESSAEGDNHKRHDHDRHDCVRSQNGEIDWPRNSLPRKPGRTVMRVIDDVRNQKYQRRGERGQLASSMRLHPAMANEIIAAQKQKETGSVKGCVEMGKNGVEVGHSEVSGQMLPVTCVDCIWCFELCTWTSYLGVLFEARW